MNDKDQLIKELVEAISAFLSGLPDAEKNPSGDFIQEGGKEAVKEFMELLPDDNPIVVAGHPEIRSVGEFLKSIAPKGEGE